MNDLYVTDREAYNMVAAEMYVEGESGYEPPQQVIASLDAEIVEAARRYADENNMQWPPAPDAGCLIYVSSL